MTELKMKLTGWKAAAALAALGLIVAARLLTFSDKTGDAALMRALETLLVCDYFPNEVERLKAAYENGDKSPLQEVVSSVTSAKLNIESVKVSYPFLDFSPSKEVVVKVVYSLKDDAGIRDRKTKYYLFKHGAIGNVWQYMHEVSSLHYRLNFRKSR